MSFFPEGYYFWREINVTGLQHFCAHHTIVLKLLCKFSWKMSQIYEIYFCHPHPCALIYSGLDPGNLTWQILIFVSLKDPLHGTYHIIIIDRQQ